MTRRSVIAALAGVSFAQKPVEFVCPMDPDVRSIKPDRCRKCGMKLVAGIPEPEEYPVVLRTSPRILAPGKPVEMIFRVLDPKSGKPVTKFELVHEKLFHLFLVSQDLEHFAHEHPELRPDGSFEFHWTPPKGGEYRLLCDFYPEGATPQMTARTIFAGRDKSRFELHEDLKPKQAENLLVSLRADPDRPLAGKKTMLFFGLEPAEGLQPYLGTWGHLLAASTDLIDLTHAHPAWEEGGPTVQFNVIFPRPGLYRLWAQFQRLGVVNTAVFNVNVEAL